VSLLRFLVQLSTISERDKLSDYAAATSNATFENVCNFEESSACHCCDSNRTFSTWKLKTAPAAPVHLTLKG
jgi:hypothetical protein